MPSGIDNLPTHSKLGASQMYRWRQCPGSVRLSEGIKGASSKYAVEGTVAHELAARMLDTTCKILPKVGDRHTVDGYTVEVTEEMLASVEKYRDTIFLDGGFSKQARLRIEHRFHLKDLHEGLYGTADCVVLFPKEKLLRVYDYKHGSGVPVEVTDNPQLMYYALGALFDTKTPVDTVELVVVQPRCYHQDGPVRRQVISTLQILDFASELLAAVKKTEDPAAALVPGEHCRWCKASAICPALQDKANDLAKLKFTPAKPYDEALLSDTLKWLPTLESWVTSVRDFAYREAERGRCPSGYKLVKKIPRRAWVDALMAEIELKNIGLKEKDIYKHRELLSPAQIEKKLDEKNKPVLEILTEIKSSGSVLVPLSDNRPELKTDAATVFAVIE